VTRRDDWQTPRADRLAADAVGRDRILAAHEAAMAAGEAGYLDPTSGLFVLTASYLSDRGWCCGEGCRHCPYEPGDERPPA
jgi:hypothetical protein